MTRSRLTAVLLVCLTALGVATSAPAFTRSDLSVAPAVSRVDAEAGKPAQETLTVVNLSAYDYHVTTAVTDIDADRSGAFTSKPAGTMDRSAAPWAIVEPTELDVAAGHTGTVHVTWTPPTGTAAGGYAAGIRFEGIGDGGRRVTGALHSFLVDVRGTAVRNEARLLHVSVPKQSFGSTVPVTLTFENSGVSHVSADGTVTVRDMLSHVAARVPVPKTFILPGHVCDVTVDVPVSWVPGRIRVGAAVSFGSRIAPGKATAEGYAFTWWSVGVLGVIALLLIRVIFGIVRFIVRRRRRRHEAPIIGPSAPLTRSAWADAEEPVLPELPRPSAVRGVAVREVAEPVREAVTPPVREVAPLPVEEVPAKPAIAASARGVYHELEALRPVPVQSERSPFAPRPRDEETVESWATAATAAAAALQPEPEPEPEEAPRPLAIWRPTPVREEPIPEPAEGAAPDGLLQALLEQVHQGLWQSPEGTRSSGAAVRRAGVALGLLAEGAGQSGARVEVGLDVLRTVEVDSEVVRLADEAYTRALRHNDTEALAPLALGLSIVKSRRAPEALLRAYGTATGMLADQLLETLKACDPDELRTHRDLFLALPKERRKALRSA